MEFEEENTISTTYCSFVVKKMKSKAESDDEFFEDFDDICMFTSDLSEASSSSSSNIEVPTKFESQSIFL